MNFIVEKYDLVRTDRHGFSAETQSPLIGSIDNAALAQIEALISKLDEISTLTGGIGGGKANEWGVRQYRYDCWLMEKPETAMKAITRNVDRSIWKDLMNKSGMLALMDAQARDEWYNNLEKDDIPISVKKISSALLNNYI